MNDDELLKGEKLERVLSPHPLSFMKYQSLCIFLIIWGAVLGWLVNFSEWNELFFDWWTIWLAWTFVLLIVSIIAALTTIRWSIFFMYLAITLSGGGIIIWLNWHSSANIFIPLYTVSLSILGFLMVELYRRSHKYVITDQRLIIKGGMMTKKERRLRYENVVEFDLDQGVLGQIFHFGTIIPQTPSGVGMGSDGAMAAGGIAIDAKKTKLFGIVGGEREVQTPRTRSYYELHGVYPFKEVTHILDKYQERSAPTTHHKEQVEFQKEQVDLQKEMRNLLKQNTTTEEKTTKEKKSRQINEEMPEPDQTDTQEKMRNFLKMQEEKNNKE